MGPKKGSHQSRKLHKGSFDENHIMKRSHKDISAKSGGTTNVMPSLKKKKENDQFSTW